MEYIKVSKEKAEEIMQPIYEYSPMFMFINGEMARVVAKDGNKVYYI